MAYIQQIVVKAVVSPWEHQRLIPTDAFRGPLSSAFDILDHINNYNIKERLVVNPSFYALIGVRLLV